MRILKIFVWWCLGSVRDENATIKSKFRRHPRESYPSPSFCLAEAIAMGAVRAFIERTVIPMCSTKDRKSKIKLVVS